MAMISYNHRIIRLTLGNAIFVGQQQHKTNSVRIRHMLCNINPSHNTITSIFNCNKSIRPCSHFDHGAPTSKAAIMFGILINK